MMKSVQFALLVGLLASLSAAPAFAQDESDSQGNKTPVTDRQLAVLTFVDWSVR